MEIKYNNDMKVSKAFKFRLKTKPKHDQLLSQWAGSCRWIYNHFLNQRITEYKENGKSLTYNDQANQLPDLKKELTWLTEPPSQSLQQTLKDLDQAFKNFFRRIKQGGEAPGFPKFKKKGLHDSFRLPEPKHFQIIGDAVKLPKIGLIKYWKSRDIEGRIRNATISKSAGHWYISFNCEIEIEVPNNQGKPLGIDRGITHTLAFSNPVNHDQANIVFADIPNSKIKSIEKKLKKAQRTLSRRKKLSCNWKKTKAEINQHHTRISNIRKDFLHKISTDIAKNHSYIVLEDLNTKEMTKTAKGDIQNPGKNVKVKARLNHEILNQGWHMFQTFLDYKSIWYGSYIDYIQPAYTSQTCSVCGHGAKENRKNQALFVCGQCGHTENADINAARNILTAGLAGRACGVSAVAGL